MIEAITMIWKHRQTLFVVAQNDIRKKYAGSVLGLAWLVIYPALFLAIYSGVYLLIFKIRLPEFSNWGYVLVVFSGLVPYIAFCESLQQASQSLVSSPHLLKNTVFPAELIPVKAVVASQTAHAVTLTVLFLLVEIAGLGGSRVWMLPIIFLIQFVWLLGAAWILSCVSVILRDVQQLLGLFLLFLLFVTPIAFLPEMVPQLLRPLLYANPLYYLVTLYRVSLFDRFSFAFIELVIFGGMSLALFFGGFTFFGKFRNLLAEYV